MSFNLRGPTGATGSNGSNGTNGAGYGGTSTSSVAIGTGSKSFTVAAGLAYVVGSRVRFADASSPTVNWMEGVVTSYSGTTLAFTSDKTAGSGTLSSWTVSLAGVPGSDGSTGATGPAGKGFAVTMATSVSIATGDITFDTNETAASTAYIMGMSVILINSDGWMYGTISEYTGSTMVVTVTSTFGSSGEPSSFIIQPGAQPGARWYTGSGTPSSGLGNDGDFYIDTGSSSYTTYTKASGSWS